MSSQIVLIAHDIRSTHNVGSLLRTAEGLGVAKVYLTGYTPYPTQAQDQRLPHIAHKIDKDIHKTALGAEVTQAWEQTTDLLQLIDQLKDQGYNICALEQAAGAISLPAFAPSSKVALLLGREVEGIEPKFLTKCDTALEIPMAGSKESFNVVQAAAMALYHISFYNHK